MFLVLVGDEGSFVLSNIFPIKGIDGVMLVFIVLVFIVLVFIFFADELSLCFLPLSDLTFLLLHADLSDVFDL